MINTPLIITFLLVSAVAFCAGYAWGSRRELYWRIKWIELEHDSARAEGREPRSIKTVAPNMRRDQATQEPDANPPHATPRLWWMNDNYTFVPLRAATLEDTLAHVFERWEIDPYGMLCGYQPKPNNDSLPGQVHGQGREKREAFEAEARAWLTPIFTKTPL